MWKKNRDTSGLSRRKFIVRTALTAGVIGQAGLLAYLHRRRRRQPSEFGKLLPVPGPVKLKASFNFFFSPVESRLAVVRTGETRQRIYVTDYPPSSPETYKLVADLPNCLEIGALAWCRSDPTHLAFAADIFEGDRLPDVENWGGLESWRRAKGMSDAEFEKRCVGKVFTVGTDGEEPQPAFSFDKRPRSPFSGDMAWAGGEAIYFAMYGNVYRGTIDKGGGHSKARILLGNGGLGELAHIANSSLDDEAKGRSPCWQ